MTTNEIKTLIQNTIAGQGSQVDIGGKLAEILGAIVDAIPSGEIPRPIVLSRLPQNGDSQSELDAIGLTDEEIQAAATGKRTAVVISSGGYYLITNAFYLPESGEYEFAFYEYDYDGEGRLYNITGYRVSRDSEGQIAVEQTSI